ncbi:MAG: CoA pyrophosphatase [Balneolaceae bacterium]|nr:CoA pyrophosphatase [Balneolaceae bacterium]
MTPHDFIAFLQERLEENLPGKTSQVRMAPEPVGEAPGRNMEPPDHAGRSAVLVLLFPNPERELELLLTLRSRDIDHGGQISFPGGRAEEGESARQTALREAREEVGLSGEGIQMLGTLSQLYMSPSNSLITPVVAYLPERPAMRLNPAEVEEIFAVELGSLATKKNLEVEQWNLSEYTYRVPFWNVHRVPLWGATAMMISELMDLFREWRS